MDSSSSRRDGRGGGGDRVHITNQHQSIDLPARVPPRRSLLSDSRGHAVAVTNVMNCRAGGNGKSGTKLRIWTRMMTLIMSWRAACEPPAGGGGWPSGAMRRSRTLRSQTPRPSKSLCTSLLTSVMSYLLPHEAAAKDPNVESCLQKRSVSSVHCSHYTHVGPQNRLFSMASENFSHSISQCGGLQDGGEHSGGNDSDTGPPWLRCRHHLPMARGRLTLHCTESPGGERLRSRNEQLHDLS